MTCKNCDTYKAELEKLKKKYEIAKSGLTDEERKILIEFIINKQLEHMIPNNEYQSNKYIILEKLKAKIKKI